MTTRTWGHSDSEGNEWSVFDKEEGLLLHPLDGEDKLGSTESIKPNGPVHL